MEFDIPAMSCGHCVKAITEALAQLDPGAKVSVDLPAKKVTLDTNQDRATVAAALTEAGYPTH
ncbi:heavy-metal-associated domain-containing protein [Polaromonas sp.]|jgi:copper chaperone|uniref:heavy-metal-associated domain-containing protein n=1 Tax=Polaromonas sp. TaxID=1869339 RepID=UPI001D5108D0|nr:heavy-metal-associated domain-containing protein [Polaromonas sp.]MBT9476665.1 heavy-metal-associated domain-containing protein [Polaromonas sp.]